jgi:hypothetical protein
MVLLYKTLNFLERNSIDPKLIHIFIVEEDQEDYNQILGVHLMGFHPHTTGLKGRSPYPSEWYAALRIIVGVKGLVKQREFIDNYFDEGVNIVSIDDDIQDIIFANAHEEIPLTEFLNNAFELCKKEQAYIWGLYPVSNAFYAQKNRWYSTHLTFICGALYGYINRPKNEDIKCVLTYNDGSMEDSERSIKYWLHDKKVIRFNTVCIKTRYFGTDGGGMGRLQDRIKSYELYSKLLHANYPSITRLRVKKSGYTDLVLKDKNNKETLRIKNK